MLAKHSGADGAQGEGWIYDVEIVAGKDVSDVHVNAETGAVLAVTDDAIDSDEDEQDPAD
jgi:hypothetical protein